MGRLEDFEENNQMRIRPPQVDQQQMMRANNNQAFRFGPPQQNQQNFNQNRMMMQQPGSPGTNQFIQNHMPPQFIQDMNNSFQNNFNNNGQRFNFGPSIPPPPSNLQWQHTKQGMDNQPMNDGRNFCGPGQQPNHNQGPRFRQQW